MTAHRPLLAAAAALLFAPLAHSIQIRLDEVQKLVPTNPVGSDQHGRSVALDGDLLLVGSPSSSHSGAGQVYAYERGPSGYELQQKFTFSLGGPGSRFGRSLAIDGARAVIANQSSAFVYARSGATWVLEQWISAPGTPTFYGSSVGIDGDTVLVGQPTMTDNQVWVWVRSAGVWSIQEKLEPPNPPQTIGFGLSVAIHGDTVVVGANQDGEAGSNAGALFVYTRSGTSWTLRAKLLGSLPFPGRRLGAAVDLQPLPGGGYEIVAGAAGPSSGEVLLFQGADASWTQTARILPSTGGSGSWFGSQVRIDGDLFVAGAWLANGPQTNSGLATVYRRCGSRWVRQGDLAGSDLATGDNFGQAVALQGDVVIAGAPAQDTVVQDGGASYVFDLGASPLALFCHGDGSASPCPCANELPPGTAGGCANSGGGGGGLALDDSLHASLDDLRAYACGLVTGESALLFAGEQREGGGSGTPFGDGLRCAGTNVVRLGSRTADALGEAAWGPGLGSEGGWSAGDTRHFQVWYRDPSGGPCNSGFNLTNGASATFAP